MDTIAAATAGGIIFSRGKPYAARWPACPPVFRGCSAAFKPPLLFAIACKANKVIYDLRQLFLGGARPQLRQPEHHGQEVDQAQKGKKYIPLNHNVQFWIQWFHEFSEVVEVVEGLLLLAGADSENFFIACNQTLMLSLDQIIFEERQKTVHSDWYHLSWWIFI